METCELPLSDDLFEETTVQQRDCATCDRPASTCLCEALPGEPLCTNTRVVILQHPMEASKRLSTVPLLPKVLRNTQVLLGRRFGLGVTSAFDTIIQGRKGAQNVGNDSCLPNCKCPSAEVEDSPQTASSASHQSHEQSAPGFKQPRRSSSKQSGHERDIGTESDRSVRKSAEASTSKVTERLVLLLFPGPEAEDLSQLSEEVPGFHNLEKTLVVIDGTWQHANEMFKVLRTSLPSFVTQVCLPPLTENVPSLTCPGGLLVRKEPKPGYVSTLEAVARALFFCEPNGPKVQEALLAPLKRMVALQAAHNPAMAAKQAQFEGR